MQTITLQTISLLPFSAVQEEIHDSNPQCVVNGLQEQVLGIGLGDHVVLLDSLARVEQITLGTYCGQSKTEPGGRKAAQASGKGLFADAASLCGVFRDFPTRDLKAEFHRPAPGQTFPPLKVPREASETMMMDIVRIRVIGGGVWSRERSRPDYSGRR
jgi:hypothetical protein